MYKMVIILFEEPVLPLFPGSILISDQHKHQLQNICSAFSTQEPADGDITGLWSPFSSISQQQCTLHKSQTTAQLQCTSSRDTGGDLNPRSSVPNAETLTTTPRRQGVTL
jgi:hypothetical protein